MHTEVIRVDPVSPQGDLIERAAAILRNGRLVAFPTETVYGLGASALDASALGKIYAAKQRPATDPIIAHIWCVAQLTQLAIDIPEVAYRLAERFWPGPLTLVLKRAAGVPSAIAEGLDTVAVRMPAHPVAAALLKAADIPVGAPSANTFTRPSATTAAHVLEDLDGRIDMLLDAGPTQIGLESTVLDLSGAHPTVLRPGGVPLDELRAVIPGLRVAPRYLDETAQSAAPGQLLKHYSPRARVELFTGAGHDELSAALSARAAALLAEGLKVAALVADEDRHALPVQVACVPLAPRADLAAIGKRLFAALRESDAQGVDVILVADFGREGLGGALWDRLLRAAEGQVVAVAAAGSDGGGTSAIKSR